MTAKSAGRFPISGAQLAAALVAIVVATAVLPPAAAWTLNEIRIAQTQARASAAAERLRVSSNGAATTGTGIACGPGRLPDLVPSTATARAAALPSHAAWLLGATMAPELFGAGMPTDAWGRCFLLNAAAWASGGPAWLLSAGPNGLVETSTRAGAPGGDDIGARVR